MAKMNKKSLLMEKALTAAEVENIHALGREEIRLFTFYCAGDLLEDLAEIRQDPWYLNRVKRIERKTYSIAEKI